MTYRYSRTCRIRAPINLAYDFHLFTPNAKLIQPWGVSVVSVDMPLEVEVGAEVGLRVSMFGIPQSWRVVWDELNPPEGKAGQRTATMTDRALQSPFQSFLQCRTFRERPGAGGGATEMTDALEYEMPFGFLGRLGQPLMQEHLAYMFYVRQRMTKQILEATAHPVQPNPLDASQAAAANAVRIRSEAAANEANPSP